MRIDLHCHSKYSTDNFLEPEDLIQKAVERMLDGVCFTEHFSVGASRDVEAIERPEGFFVFRGVEISTGQGHLLAYGLKDDSWNRWSKNLNLNAAEVIEAVHDCGGICVPAHPFRGWDSFGEEVYRIQGLDALETHNGCSSEEANRKAVQAALLRKLPSLGGSDCHTKDQVGRAYTVFKNHVHTMIELVEEIKRGNCEGVML